MDDAPNEERLSHVNPESSFWVKDYLTNTT